MSLPSRIIITTQDIMNICKVSKATAGRHRSKIKTEFKIPRKGYIFLEHFCAYFKIKEDKAREFLE